MSRLLRVALVVAVAMTGACGKSATAPDPTTGLPGGQNAPGNTAPLVFTSLPLDPAAITTVTPIGNLNPPGHSLPTNHMYFLHPAGAFVVFAPASGTVTEVRRQTDDAITVKVNATSYYYLYHLLVDPTVKEGIQLTAGQRIGVTITQPGGLDLGAWNESLTLFFVKPQRYTLLTLHCESPIKYFDTATRALFAAKINRTGDDKEGRIDFDKAGTLSGNWFTFDVPMMTESENTAWGTKVLSFVRDVAKPNLVAISVGGTITTPGEYFVQESAPDPASVTMATGRVAYQLYTDPSHAVLRGVLIVQITGTDQITVEVLPADSPPDTAFTANATLFRR